MDREKDFEKLMKENEIKQNAANVIKTTQKIIDDFESKIDLNDKLLLEGAIAELKNVLINNDMNHLEDKTNILKKVALQISEKIYNNESKSENLEETKEIKNINDKTIENSDNLDEKKVDSEDKKGNKKEKKKKGKNNKKKKIIIIIIITSILILSILSYFLFFKKDVIYNDNNYYYKNGTLYFKNKDGVELGTYKCTNKNKDLCMVAYEYNDDDFDMTRNVSKNHNNYNKTRSKIYNNRYVFIKDNKVKKNSSIFLYDIKDNKKVGNYKGVKSYKVNSNNIVVVKKSAKKQLLLKITKNNVKKTDKLFDYLGVYHFGNNYRFITKDNDVYNVYDEDFNSKFVTKNQIKSLNDNYIVLKDTNYILSDYNNKEITKDYDFIKVYSDFYVGIKDNILKVFDYNNKELLPEEIKLNNNYYNKLNVIKNNKIIDVLQSFNVKSKNGEIEIVVYDNKQKETYSYNIFELELNSKLEYYSYSKNKLYFYKDKNKKDLLGNYKCSNKNIIDKDTQKLSSCYIYHNNVKEHIFSNRYTFIKDGSSVNLYDITTQKVLGTYADVTFSVDNDFFINDNVYVNTYLANKKIGLIKLLKSNVQNLINNEYDLLERINDNYVKAKKNDSYQLLDINGKLLKANFKNNLYTIKNSSSLYEIYSFEGSKQVSGVFTNVKFYDKYVAAVTSSNVLFLYNYKTDRLIDGIGVSSKTGFDITDSGSTTIIAAGNKTYKYNNSVVPFTKIEDNNYEEDE